MVFFVTTSEYVVLDSNGLTRMYQIVKFVKMGQYSGPTTQYTLYIRSAAGICSRVINFCCIAYL